MPGEGTEPIRQSLGFTYGYAVVLSSRRAVGSLPSGADADILCDGTGLDTIGAFIERALKSWAGKVDPNARTVSCRKVIEAMLPSMKLVPSLVARIDAEGSVLHRLTSEQAHFLEFARAQPRARVWGVAGSGNCEFFRSSTCVDDLTQFTELWRATESVVRNIRQGSRRENTRSR